MINLEQFYDAVITFFDDFDEIDIRSCKYTESSTKILKFLGKKTRSNDTRNQKQLYKLWNKPNVQHEVKVKLKMKTDIRPDASVSEYKVLDDDIGLENIEQPTSQSRGENVDWEQMLFHRLKYSLSTFSILTSDLVHQIDVSDFWDSYNNHYKKTYDAKENDFRQARSLLTPTHTEEQIKLLSWQNVTKNIKCHGVYYNLSLHSENIDALYLDLSKKCVTCETSSSFVRRLQSEVRKKPPSQPQKVDRPKLTNMFLTPTYQLSRKLSWVVQTTLVNETIDPKHRKYSIYSSVLTKVVKRLYHDIRDEKFINIDTLMRIAKSNVYWVLRGKTAEEIYFMAKK